MERSFIPDVCTSTYPVLAGVAGSVSAHLEPRHTVFPHCLLWTSFVVFSPSYAPVVRRENKQPKFHLYSSRLANMLYVDLNEPESSANKAE